MYATRVRRTLGDSSATIDPSVLAQVAAIYAFYMGTTFLTQQFATGVIPYAQSVTAGQISLNDVERDLASFWATNVQPTGVLAPAIVQRVGSLYQRLTGEQLVNNQVNDAWTNGDIGSYGTNQGLRAQQLVAYGVTHENPPGGKSAYVPLPLTSDVQAIITSNLPAAAVAAAPSATSSTGSLSDIPTWGWLLVGGGVIYALSR